MIENSTCASPARDRNIVSNRALRALLGSTILASVLMTGTSVTLAQDSTALSATQVTMLQRLVVTATRGTQRVLDVPATITVIGKDQLDQRVVRDIQDLVRTEPGVSVDRQTSITNPFGQLTGFTVRGMTGNRVQMLVDGSRVQERITGHRSEERRVGKECIAVCRSRWSPYH